MNVEPPSPQIIPIQPGEVDDLGVAVKALDSSLVEALQKEPPPQLARIQETQSKNKPFLKKVNWHIRRWALGVFTLLVIQTMAVLFFAGVAPWVYTNVRGGVAIVVIVAILYLTNLAMYAFTTLRNPGIIPKTNRAGMCPVAVVPGKGQQLEQYDQSRYPFWGTGGIKEIAMPKEAGEDGILLVKWCSTCGLWRPLRSSHCRYCGGCVIRYDHHCFWVSNCVGYRNYGFFYAFIATLTLILCLTFPSAIYMLVQKGDIHDYTTLAEKWKITINDNGAVVALVVMEIALGWFPLILLLFHTFLIFSARTTREQMRDPRDRKQDGYKLWTKPNILQNAKSQLCGSLHPLEERIEDL